MIKADNLVKIYGTRRVVDDVSIHVNKGEVLGFLGPNGAGKSTSMRMITGFLPMDGGTVKIGDYDIEKDPIKAKSLIGYLPEHAPSYGEMKVIDFLSFIAELRQMKGKSKKSAIEKAIATCFLEPVQNQSIQTLSKGYRHRTCFAQALLHDPEILILDEPTDGLDPNQKDQMRRLIKEMGKTKAIIISTHILEEVDAVCSRVCMIDKGKMVFEGNPKSLRERSTENNNLLLTVAGESIENFSTALNELDSVETSEIISQDEDSVSYRITSNTDHKLEAEINRCLNKSGLTVISMYRDRGSLQDVFRELTIGAEEKYDY